MTCPSPPTQPSPPRLHPLADIFPDSPPSTPPIRPLTTRATSVSASPTAEVVHEDVINVASDMPRLRATHSTAGYRDGIAAAKTPWLQRGFDEGYSLGAVLGLRVGYMLGVLEGLWAAFVSGEKKGRKNAGESEGEGADEARGEEEAKRLAKLLAEAKTELALEKVFGQEWWGEDGMWKFAVEPPRGGAGGDGNGNRNNSRGDDHDDDRSGEVTFVEVADQHPLLERWSNIVRAEMQRLGVRENTFEGEEWEKGRVLFTE
ncbi:Essential protein Yae1, N terminal [Sticta canariensis]|nr:Essential protein Yae1, N terminal [Sticta canariensis]